jgi:hypothetical protein
MRRAYGIPTGDPKDIQAWRRQQSVPEAAGGLSTPVFAFPAPFFPPPNARNFYRTGTATVGPGPATTVIAGTPLVLPQNTVGVIRDISFDVNNLLLSSLIFFTLRINGGGVEGFTNIQMFPRAVASVSLAFDPGTVQVRIPSGATIDVFVRVTDAGTYPLGATFRGWFYGMDVAALYDPNGSYS